MNIRPAVKSDLDSVTAIDHIARVDSERGAFIVRTIRDAAMLVAELDGQIVGYGVLEYWFFGNGFISMVYVTQESRRIGVGTRLMESLADCCTTSKLFTSTNESNAAMQALLRKQGYERSGVIFNLDPGDPELVYYRPIEPGGA